MKATATPIKKECHFVGKINTVCFFIETYFAQPLHSKSSDVFSCRTGWEGTYCDQLPQDSKGYDSTAIIAGSVLGVFLVCLIAAVIIALMSRFACFKSQYHF